MITPDERARIARIMGETEPLDAITRSNETRERLVLCTCDDPDRSGIGWTCALHHNKETRAVAAEEALKPRCPDLTGAQSAQMAKLIRKIEDMEFSMMRAINHIEHGYRGEAKAELIKWVKR